MMPGSEAPAVVAPTLLAATVGDRIRRERVWDESLAPGLLVFVRWGYGSGFRAHGKGRILKVNRLSVQVELLEDVADPYKPETVGWPKGYILTGIARFLNPRWDQYNSVAPLLDPTEGGV